MPNAYIQQLHKEGKGSIAALEAKWEKAKSIASEANMGDNYAYITGIFKKMIGLSASAILREEFHSPPAPPPPSRSVKAFSDDFYRSMVQGFRETLASNNPIPDAPGPKPHTPEVQASDAYSDLPAPVAEANREHDAGLLRTDATQIAFAELLPFVSKAYKISADPDDYIFRPIPLFLSDIPNRNGISFPIEELVKWNVDAGCQSYMSWKGKPMHVEHKDEDPEDAIGFIVDVRLVPLVGYGENKTWKVIALGALDLTKNKIVKDIDSGERNTYSMGCVVDSFSCSYCGKELGHCSHLDEKSEKVQMYELNGRLVFKRVHGILGKELSSVGDPAAAVCSSDFDHILLK